MWGKNILKVVTRQSSGTACIFVPVNVWTTLYSDPDSVPLWSNNHNSEIQQRGRKCDETLQHRAIWDIKDGCHCIHNYVLPVLAAIFDSPLTSMSESVHISSGVLAEPNNVDVAFGIRLLSSKQAKILRCFISTSSYWQPSLICDSRRHCSVNISHVVLLDHNNAGLVLGLSLLFFIEAVLGELWRTSGLWRHNKLPEVACRTLKIGVFSWLSSWHVSRKPTWKSAF